jgi:hypothetical protein
LRDTRERFFEIDPDIVGERLQRRNIKHRDFIAHSAPFGLMSETVDRPHEGGEGLAATGRRAEQDVVRGRTLGLRNRGPSEALGAGRRGEASGEPGAHRRMEFDNLIAHSAQL